MTTSFSSRPIRVLSLQSFYGGSHRQFIDGWRQASFHRWSEFNLPARHWKWRMRHSAIWFARQIAEAFAEGQRWDLLLVTDMTNVAELRGLLAQVDLSLASLPIIIYFHENQFGYPSRAAVGSPEEKRDQHFAFTNFISALAADQCWFNSGFNLTSLRLGLATQAKRWPDHVPPEAEDELQGEKFRVAPPGISIPAFDWALVRKRRVDRAYRGEPLRIVWAARWEHDKNPEALLAALHGMRKSKLPFQLSLIGQSFRHVPEAFEKIKQEFSGEIIDWGWQESREDYWQVLARGDVFLSTANHEFFGLAAAEGIASGLRPVLPNRLAYPGLLNLAGIAECRQRDLLYDDGELCNDVSAILEQLVCVNRRRNSDPESWLLDESLLDRFRRQMDWPTRAKEMDAQLAAVVN